MLLTWNVGHKAPLAEELDKWLPPRGEGLDVVIVATQENAYIVKAKSASVKTPGELRSTAANDADSDDENESPERETSVSTPVKRRKFIHRPWLWRKLRQRVQLSPRASVGKGDWTTTLTCGKNLLGRHEGVEHWERLVLAQLNAGGSGGGGEVRWRISKHAVLAEMRLTVYVRVLEDRPTPPPAALTARRSSLEGAWGAVRRRVSSFSATGGVTVAHRDRVALGQGGLVANKGGLAIEVRG